MITFKKIKDWLNWRNIINFRTYSIGSKHPVWISDKNYYDLYDKIPELKLAISRKINMIIGGKLRLRTDEGDIIESHPVLDLMKRPNPLQKRNDFIAQVKLSSELYGNSFVKKIAGTFDEVPKAIWSLPANYMKIVPTGKIFDQIDIDEIIDYYELESPNIKQKFEPREILHLKVSSDSSYFAAQSPLMSLIKPLSNIERAYRARNIVLGDLGALGILSFGDNKDSAGALPIGDAPQKVEAQYREKYGTGDGQARVITSKVPVRWQSISYPLRDLMTFEEVQEDFIKIVESVGLNINLFSSVQGGTYENVNQARKGAYENTIIPESMTLMQNLSEFIGLRDKGMYLYLDYSHLPIMQEDKLMKEQAMSNRVSYITQMLDKGLISLEEAIAKLNEKED